MSEITVKITVSNGVVSLELPGSEYRGVTFEKGQSDQEATAWEMLLQFCAHHGYQRVSVPDDRIAYRFSEGFWDIEAL